MLIPAYVFSQKVVNGFGLEVFLGNAYSSPNDHLKLNYNGEQYQLAMTGESDVFGGTAYFPFDMGIKRHRFIIAPGLEYRTSKVYMESNPQIIGSDYSIKDNIHFSSTTYTPLLQVLYRPHFYLGKIHMSFTIGANFKYTVYGTLEIADQDNSAIATYKKDLQESDNEYIDFGNNYPAQRMRDINFHIDPRLGFDFYIGNSFMISLFGIVPDVTSAAATKSIKLEYGAGVTYLIRTNKITEAKILQQYKK